MGRLSTFTHSPSGSWFTVTTNDGMRVTFTEKAPGWRERIVLFLIRRWFPDSSLARVETWPYDGQPPSSAEHKSQEQS